MRELNSGVINASLPMKLILLELVVPVEVITKEWKILEKLTINNKQGSVIKYSNVYIQYSI